MCYKSLYLSSSNWNYW